MKRLINEFSWSFSRHQSFSECLKKYWYNYYGSWEGWPLRRNDPRGKLDPLSAKLYLLKQMQTLPTFVGSLVHSIIEKSLKAYQKSKKLASLEDLLKELELEFKKGISEAQGDGYLRDPKRKTNLFEFYYNHLQEGAIEASLEKAKTCLKNWYHSPILQNFALSDRASFVGIENLEHFFIDKRYKVWVVMDFAVRWQRKEDDLFVLFDWKTGAVSEKTGDQLLSYALFAKEKWNLANAQITLVPFYLQESKSEKIGEKEPISEAELSRIESFIRASCEEMSKCLDQPQQKGQMDNQASIENFPYTENRYACKRCVYKELCEKAEFKEMNEEELRSLLTPLSI